MNRTMKRLLESMVGHLEVLVSSLQLFLLLLGSLEGVFGRDRGGKRKLEVEIMEF